LKRLFEEGNAKGVLLNLADKIGDILAAIDAAVEIEDVSLYPGWRLHPLKGDLRDFWSISVSGNCGLFSVSRAAIRSSSILLIITRRTASCP
jgi:plasmid maintenance system killer protein